MQIRVAFIMLMMLGITINALTSDDALDVVPEEFIADDVVSEILLMQTPEPDKVAPKNTSKYISHPVEHLRHVHEKMQGIRTVHKASEDTQTKLAEVTGLLAVATQQTPSSSHNHSALDTAISTAINAISNDLSSGHSTDSTYISNLYTSSTNAVSTSVSNSLTAVNTKKSEWCPAKRALEDAQSTKSTKQTALENLFANTAAMKSTCSKTWTETKPTVESAFDSVTAAKSTYTTAKTEYDSAVSAENLATTTESEKSSAFTTTLNNEATSTNSQCTNTVSSYNSAKIQVSSNVATRKHTKTLLEYLRCYLRDVLDGTATAADIQACQAATVDTTSYDITMTDMATCDTADTLKASWGPVAWTPTLTSCHANGGAAEWTLKSPAPSCPDACDTAASVLPRYDCRLTHSSHSAVPVDASRCAAQPSDFNLDCPETPRCTTPAPPPGPVSPLDNDNLSTVFVTRDGATVIASGGLMVPKRSTDGGATFSEIASLTSYTTNWGPSKFRDMAGAKDGTRIHATDWNYIWTSTDLGVNWSQASTGTTTLSFAHIAASDDGMKAYATIYGTGNIYYTHDGGTSWTLKSGVDPHNALRSICTSSDGTVVAMASWFWAGGVSVSTDSGVTWVEKTNPLRDHLQTIACSPDGQTLVVGAGRNGVFVSDDQGTTWSSAHYLEGTTPGAAAYDITKVTICSDGTFVAMPYWPWGFKQNSGDTNGAGRAPFTSTDRGVTWTAASDIAWQSGPHMASIFCQDNGHLWMPFSEGLWSGPK